MWIWVPEPLVQTGSVVWTQRSPRINRNVLFFVSAVAVVFLLAGAILGIWSAKEMRETVSEQFNQQQLAVPGMSRTHREADRVPQKGDPFSA